MKRVSIVLAGFLLLLAGFSPAMAEEPTRLSDEARESISHLNLNLPAQIPQVLELPDRSALNILPANVAPWPTVDWTASTPEEQGMNRAKLTDAFRYAAQNKAKAVLVIRNGYIVGEWYAKGWNKRTQQHGFSMSKSVSSSLIGMLIDDGVITGVDEPVSDFVPEWSDAEHGAVTVRRLLSMDSGLHWDLLTDALLVLSPDQTQYATGLPMDHPPGEVWLYHNSACQMLSEVILQASGMQAQDFGRDRLFDVIGMWNATWMSDSAGNTLTYMGVGASAREFAKFGYLYLRGGVWEDNQVLSADWVAASLQPSQPMNTLYGYLWWLNTAGAMWPNVPEDAFAAIGMNEKRIYVVPSLDIVAVRLGAPQPSWDDNVFLGRICASVIW